MTQYLAYRCEGKHRLSYTREYTTFQIEKDGVCVISQNTVHYFAILVVRMCVHPQLYPIDH